VYRWYKMFSEGREDVNDEERARRPSTSTTDENIDEVKKIVLANRRITVREVAEDLNISIGSCHSIFTNDLGMRRVAAKFVPKLLNFDQKKNNPNIIFTKTDKENITVALNRNSYIEKIKSLAMAEEISKATLNVLNECIVIVDEELILFDESDDEENFKELCIICSDDPKLDADNILEDYKEFSAEYIPLAYKEKVVALAQAHPKWSLTTLQKYGASRLKQKGHLQRWIEDVKKGGTRLDKLGKINSEIFKRFSEARCRLE
ncbi:SETMR methyltransferase, partial [Acromyrmex heyeri]